MFIYMPNIYGRSASVAATLVKVAVRYMRAGACLWAAAEQKDLKKGLSSLLFNVHSQILNILKLLHTFVKSVQFKRN